MKRLILVLTAGALALFGLVLAAPTAAGDDKVLSDPKFDAPARIDVTKFRVENRIHWFEMRVDVRDLRQRGEFNFIYERGGDGVTSNDPSVIIEVRRVDGKTKARLYPCGHEDCSEPTPCPKIRLAWRASRDFVRVEAPQKCLWWTKKLGVEPPIRGTFSMYSATKGKVDSVPDLVVKRG